MAGDCRTPRRDEGVLEAQRDPGADTGERPADGRERLGPRSPARQPAECAADPVLEDLDRLELAFFVEREAGDRTSEDDPLPAAGAGLVEYLVLEVAPLVLGHPNPRPRLEVVLVGLRGDLDRLLDRHLGRQGFRRVADPGGEREVLEGLGVDGRCGGERLVLEGLGVDGRCGGERLVLEGLGVDGRCGGERLVLKGLGVDGRCGGERLVLKGLGVDGRCGRESQVLAGLRVRWRRRGESKVLVRLWVGRRRFGLRRRGGLDRLERLVLERLRVTRRRRRLGLGRRPERLVLEGLGVARRRRRRLRGRGRRGGLDRLKRLVLEGLGVARRRRRLGLGPEGLVLERLGVTRGRRRLRLRRRGGLDRLKGLVLKRLGVARRRRRLRLGRRGGLVRLKGLVLERLRIGRGRRWLGLDRGRRSGLGDRGEALMLARLRVGCRCGAATAAAGAGRRHRVRGRGEGQDDGRTPERRDGARLAYVLPLPNATQAQSLFPVTRVSQTR